MATFSIDLPDELANRLEPLREHLPDLLAKIVTPVDPKPATVAENPVYTEVLDFLLHRPTPDAIVAFKVSPRCQNRLQFLLDKNRESTLTAEENAELDTYEQLEHLMILLKTRAMRSIS
ncbi:hypothetical protein V0288_06545 [Pannus brasiliensis CCIBt3594]|uniref:Uncharacterized protein n=1 Tax=Pannus brasiliensis CCIBt3594 TaxID=1427578 RepID=A0AAW9QNS9_9CHRO